MSVDEYVYSKRKEQYSANRGRISEENIPGEYIEVASDSPHHVGEKTTVVDGLPRIGAEAEDMERGKTHKHKLINTLVRPFAPDSTPKEIEKKAGDKAGEKAMTREIGNRAYRQFRKRGRGIIDASSSAAHMERNFDRNYLAD